MGLLKILTVKGGEGLISDIIHHVNSYQNTLTLISPYLTKYFLTCSLTGLLQQPALFQFVCLVLGGRDRSRGGLTGRPVENAKVTLTVN